MKTIKNFFDIITCMFEKHYPSIEDINKHTNIYMINMVLSCDEHFVKLANEMSKLKLTNKQYFDIMYYGLPKGKRYIKYIASKTKKLEDEKYLQEWFGVSQDIARGYVELIDPKEMKEITEYYEHRGIYK